MVLLIWCYRFRSVYRCLLQFFEKIISFEAFTDGTKKDVSYFDLFNKLVEPRNSVNQTDK